MKVGKKQARKITTTKGRIYEGKRYGKVYARVNRQRLAFPHDVSLSIQTCRKRNETSQPHPPPVFRHFVASKHVNAAMQIVYNWQSTKFHITFYCVTKMKSRHEITPNSDDDDTD